METRPESRGTRPDPLGPRTDHDPGADHDPPVAASGGWLRETPFWAVSALLHTVLFVVLVNLVMSAPSKEADAVIILVDRPTPPPERPERPRERDAIPVPALRPTLKPATIELEDVPPDFAPREEPKETLPIDPLIAVGAGPLAGRPTGEFVNRGKRICDGLGTGPDDAVRAALDWLVRHQDAGGGWRAQGFVASCENIAKPCRNLEPVGDGIAPADGRGFEAHDIGVTALAMLAFTGYGHTHHDGRFPDYVATLKSAARYMKSLQVRSNDPRSNGRFGHPDTPFDKLPEQWIYDHAIATMAMGELLAMSGDQLGLRRSVSDAVKLCLLGQNPGYGWKYGIQPGRNDSSVTGWMVLALKTAKNAGIDVPRSRIDESFAGALRWYDRATSAASGKTGYEVPGDEGSRLAAHAFARDGRYPFSKELSCMTAVGVLCRLFAGEARSSPIVKKGVDILMRERPAWSGEAPSKINFYYWYYGSYALFQFGGSLWERWNTEMKSALVKSQRQGGDEDGSWDPIGEWGPAGGRVYSTALGAMTLEVYYRYLRAK